MSEWQPIETAPKDGTNLLLYCGPDYDPIWGIGYWHEPTEEDAHYFSHPEFPDKELAAKFLTPGWRIWFDYDFKAAAWPEYWTDLPNPPKDKP